MPSQCNTIVQDRRAIRISIGGELDHHRARHISRYIEDQIDCNLPLALTLDLTTLTFTDSSGIAVLLRAKRSMSGCDGTLVIIGVGAQPLKVFGAAGLDKILEFEGISSTKMG